MATIGSTVTVPSVSDGKDWTLTTSLDTTTGELTYNVNGSSGRLIYSGSFETVMAGVDATIAAPDVAQSTKEFFAVLRGSLTSENSIWAPQSQTIKDESKTTQPPASPAPDAAKASATVVDGDKTGDSAPAPSAASSSSATGTTNAGPTTAGKTGAATSSDPASIVGKRTYNPLGDFSSYTYKIGLYMMNPEQFNQYMDGDYTKISTFKLIAQSGGITKALDSERDSNFPLDLYIDDLEIISIINSKETKTATSSVNFRFKIYEPYGFSFPNQLVKAQLANAQNNKSTSGAATTAFNQINALNENFLLTIKFYGYDKNGKIVSSVDYPQADITKSDTQSVFERAFPVRINKFTFKLENKLTVYNISCVQTAEQMAKGTKLGGLPTNITLSGESVRDVLVGASQDSSKKAILGLVQALNATEAENIKQEIYTYPNVYKIEFESGSGIGDARMVPKEYYVKERTPFTSILNPEGSNARTEWSNRLGTIDKAIRTVELQAGTSIVQAIDQIITQSEHIKNMMKAVDVEITDPVTEGSSTVDKNPNPKVLSWYSIIPRVKISSPIKDPKRNDYAYEITYKVQEYQIPYIRALYASKTLSYYGPHKKYNYWYTGLNTEVLSYEQDFNTLYTVDAAAASSAKPTTNQSAAITTKSGMDADSTNTSKSGTNDIVNSVKSFLYSPEDLMKFKIKVLGDPDYLMPAIGSSGTNGLQKWYGDNSTINPNSGQVFMEIYFQQVEDYNNSTGLLSPNANIQFLDYPAELKDKIQGIVYMITDVISTFSKGRFEQTIKGIIPEFGQSGLKPSTTPPAAPNTRTAESAPKLEPTVTFPAIAAMTTPIATSTATAEDDNPGITVDPTGQGIPEVQGRPRGGV